MVDRETVLEEKGHSCTVCGAEGEVQIHHVDGDRNNNSLENLEPVCGSCHYKIHNGELEEWSKKILPKEQRNREKAVRTKPEDARRLRIIQEMTAVDEEADAYRYAVKATVDRLSTMDRRRELVQQLRVSPSESEAEVQLAALEFQAEIVPKIEELLGRAARRGSVAPDEVAEVLDTDRVSVKYEKKIRWNVGTDD